MANSENCNFGISPLKKKDCFFFVEYGICSYGKNCRYNHPPQEDSQVIPERSAEILFANYIRRKSCKHFRAGYCKYGSYCGFNHSIPDPPLQYNSVGLPMRLGEEVCSFYMNNHWCGYGAGCKFHHPELNYFAPQEYGSHAFVQAREYRDGPLGSAEGELVLANE